MRQKLIAVEPDLVPNLLKVVKLLVRTTEIESASEIFRLRSSTNSEKRFNVAREYEYAAKKSLVSHRFISASKLLDIVCQQAQMDPVFFFKAASTVLENNSLSTEDDFFKFTCHVHGLMYISKYEVTLEYVVHSLRRKDLEGYSTLEAVIFGQKLNATRNFMVDPLLKAYLGLLQYLKWMRNRVLGQESNIELAQKIINIFKEAIEAPGQWDVFILKLVEMLEFYERRNEIEEVLMKYVEMNPGHINSFIYICEYLQKHQYSSQKHLEYLKELAKCSPSDSRVLTLVEMTSVDNLKKAVKLLFKFLDYPCNKGDVKAWKLLSDILEKMLKKHNGILTKITSSWLVNRSHIWNFIHFSNHELNNIDSESAKLFVDKAVVLCILDTSSHPFVLTVVDHLPQISESLSETLENKIADINNMKDAVKQVEVI